MFILLNTILEFKWPAVLSIHFTKTVSIKCMLTFKLKQFKTKWDIKIQTYIIVIKHKNMKWI